MSKKNLRFDTGTIEKVESGKDFLKAKVVLAKAGVFPYLYPNGKIFLEAKLPDELFSQATLDSAKNIPVTEDHPPFTDSGGLVTSSNYKKYVKGSLGDSLEVQGEYIIAHEMIYDSDLRKKIESGEKIEVSIGFETDVEFSAGEFGGVRYDAIQRNIRINHLAHVSEGRAGSDVRAHLDSKDDSIEFAIMYKEKNMSEPKNDKSVFNPLKEFILRIFKADSEAELAQALDQVSKANDTVEKATPPANASEQTAMADTIKKLQNEIDLLKAMLDEKSKALDTATSASTMDAKIQSRFELVEKAKTIIPDFKSDGLSNSEIQLKVIEAIFPNKFKHDSVNQETTEARFEAAVEVARERASSRNENQNTETRIDENSIRAKREARLNVNKEEKT